MPWLLIGDYPQQTPVAEQAFLDAIASGAVYLPEVAWVLRGYDLEQFRQGGDLADQLILARATNTGALPVLSFYCRFAASEDV